MKAVITVTGKDSVGIIAKVSALCAEHDANIVDITQSVMQEYFAMIMLVEIDSLKVKFADLQIRLQSWVKKRDSAFPRYTRIFLTQCTTFENYRSTQTL